MDINIEKLKKSSKNALNELGAYIYYNINNEYMEDFFMKLIYKLNQVFMDHNNPFAGYSKKKRELFLNALAAMWIECRKEENSKIINEIKIFQQTFNLSDKSLSDIYSNAKDISSETLNEFISTFKTDTLKYLFVLYSLHLYNVKDCDKKDNIFESIVKFISLLNIDYEEQEKILMLSEGFKNKDYGSIAVFSYKLPHIPALYIKFLILINNINEEKFSRETSKIEYKISEIQNITDNRNVLTNFDKTAFNQGELNKIWEDELYHGPIFLIGGVHNFYFRNAENCKWNYKRYIGINNPKIFFEGEINFNPLLKQDIFEILNNNSTFYQCRICSEHPLLFNVIDSPDSLIFNDCSFNRFVKVICPFKNLERTILNPAFENSVEEFKEFFKQI